MKLAGSRALITGGAGGIGSAIAAELLDAGASVLLADMNAAALAATAARLGQEGDCGARVVTAVANLGDDASRSALCGQAQQWGVNILVNNAGVNHFGLYDELGEAQIAQTMAINVLAPMLLVRALLPHFMGQPSAGVLNVGSMFGLIGYPGYAAYGASKFALRGFSEALRRELAGTGVKVHHLAPRATRTPINSGAVERMNAELKVAMDPPQVVARAARRLLERGGASAVVGWPEKLFARINAVMPALVDGAIAKQLPVIRRYAREQADARPASLPPGSSHTGRQPA
jgi:short-subunit dehydrogenase